MFSEYDKYLLDIATIERIEKLKKIIQKYSSNLQISTHMSNDSILDRYKKELIQYEKLLDKLRR